MVYRKLEGGSGYNPWLIGTEHQPISLPDIAVIIVINHLESSKILCSVSHQASSEQFKLVAFQMFNNAVIGPNNYFKESKGYHFKVYYRKVVSHMLKMVAVTGRSVYSTTANSHL